uniref:Uncharacterized protein n=1 Tax=Physcomitrium patens TaxID=3218 RepID=A0A2K1LBB1_PHYPA|nr:hypothetical protein PHYPA_001750 [Physcomitrium patens]
MTKPSGELLQRLAPHPPQDPLRPRFWITIPGPLSTSALVSTSRNLCGSRIEPGSSECEESRTIKVTHPICVRFKERKWSPRNAMGQLSR